MFSLAGSEAVPLIYFDYGFITFRGVQVEYLSGWLVANLIEETILWVETFTQSAEAKLWANTLEFCNSLQKKSPIISYLQ